MGNGLDVKRQGLRREKEAEVSESDFDWPSLIIHQGPAHFALVCLWRPPPQNRTIAVSTPLTV